MFQLANGLFTMRSHFNLEFKLFNESINGPLVTSLFVIRARTEREHDRTDV